MSVSQEGNGLKIRRTFDRVLEDQTGAKRPEGSENIGVQEGHGSSGDRE